MTTRRFDVGLYGRGGVIGVNFHLGGTLAFSTEAPALIRDTTVPAGDWFPGIDEDLGLVEKLDAGQVRDADLHSAAEVLQTWLLSRQPTMTEGYARFRQVLDVLDDPSIISLG